MRQAEASQGHEDWADRSLDRSANLPDALLYRGRTGDGADCLVTFDRSNIVISRPLAGLPCKIRLNLRQYQAVAVVATNSGNIIRMTHREPGLSIDIADMAKFDDAEDYRDRLAAFLDLPTLMLAGNGAAKGRTAKASDGRRTKTNRTRRPRFLSRRKTGEVISIRKIDGRELIARH